MTLSEAIEKAAKELPEGYRVSLTVERGSAWVRVEFPDGIEIDIEIQDSLAEAVEKAIEIARKRKSDPVSTRTRGYL